MLARFPLACLVLFQDAAPTSLESEVVPLEISAQDPLLPGHGASKTIERAIPFSGTLYVWTKATELDLFLRIEDSEGKVLAEDDSSGGGTTPCIALPVVAGTKLGIGVAASKPDAAGSFELHLVRAPESPEVRAAIEAARTDLEEIERLRKSKDLAQLRAKAPVLIARFLSLPGSDSSAGVTDALARCASVAYGAGALQPARDGRRRVLEFRERTLPPDHQDLQAARRVFANVQGALGDLHGAGKLYEQVLEVDERTLPPDDRWLQDARLNLAANLATLGQHERARQLDEQALAVLSRTVPDDHPDLQRARANFAALLRSTGEFVRARILEESVLEVRARTLAPDDNELLIIRNNLAGTLVEMGDYARALELREKVLEARSRLLPDDHPELQRARENLAILLMRLGQLDRARELEAKVLEVRSRSLPEDHPELCRARLTFATILKETGDTKAARGLEEQVLEARSRTLPNEDLTLNKTRGNLAETLAALGELDAARSLQETVIEVFDKTLPAEHPGVREARMGLATTLVVAGEMHRAGAVASEILRAVRASIRAALSSAPPREAEERAFVMGTREISFAISLAPLLDPADRAALDLEVFASAEASRGAGLVVSRVLQAAGAHPEISALRGRVSAASADLARMAQGEGSSGEFGAVFEERERAQGEFVRLLSEESSTRALLADPTAESLASGLAPETALVGYWRYARQRSRRENWIGGGTVDSLLAFVVRSGASAGGIPVLSRIDLGPIADIEQAISRWRDALRAPIERGVAAGASGTDALLESSEAVRRLVFDPLRPALKGASRLIVALDDEMTSVPLEALPDEGSGPPGKEKGAKLLGERFAIEIRPTLRELLLPDRPVPTIGIVVALGGASFNSQPEAGTDPEPAPASPQGAAPAEVASRSPKEGASSGDAWQRSFDPLPQTAVEVQGIAALHAEVFPKEPPVRLLEKRHASRAALDAFAPQARWLHLATHGWFAPESVRSTEDREPLDIQLGFSGGSSREDRFRGLSPLVLCGLALAGANLPRDSVGRFPGLITAEEIAALDLTGCELAVLSACDTNQGVRRAGQGVASLQKALHMAGARSVITSLWKVPDEATKDLMIDFYRRIWVEKKPKARALWESKMRLRDARDEKGKPLWSTRDWAGWVLTGEPR